jgi:5-methyltetrahydrofolate--homocysteine methyltransferase
MGSELMKKGLSSGDIPEIWNIEHAYKVKEIQSAYIDAGARFVLTNTFGGKKIKMTTAGVGDRLDEANRAAVRNLKDVAGDDVCIAGDMGSTGDFLEPVGMATRDQFIEAFAVQAKPMAEEGVDCFLIETMADLQEVGTAIEGIRSVCDLPIGASVTFEKDASGDSFHTMMGVDIESYVAFCHEQNIDIIGTNCGKGVHETIEVIRKIKSLTEKPVLAFPNAGVPVVKDGQTVYEQSADVMKPYFEEMIEMGVNIIGGCRGTNPEHIKLISSLIN